MPTFSVQVIGRNWLTPETFEIRFSRPPGLSFMAGQKIRFLHERLERDYSLLNAPADPELSLLVRLIPGGAFTPVLAEAPVGRTFTVSAPLGFFTYRDTVRQAVFAATGTGIAPFAAFARSGVRDFILLHGVRSAGELYYQPSLAAAAKTYIACLSGPPQSAGGRFKIHQGRLTGYLERELPIGNYDFYLCGRREMIRDATRVIDRKFSGSYLFSELYF